VLCWFFLGNGIQGWTTRCGRRRDLQHGDVVYSYDDLVDALNVEAATLPPKTWRDGVWDISEYMTEASLVRIIETVEDHNA
jgi:hypothetical protein